MTESPSESAIPSTPPEVGGKPAASSTRSPLRNPLVVGIAVVAVAAIIVAIVASSGSSKPSGTRNNGSPTSFADAVSSTLKSNNVTLTFTISANEAGKIFSITGNGGCNVPQKACELTESLAGDPTLGADGPFTELIVDKVLYLKLGPALQSELPEPWISIPIKSSSAPSKDATAVSALPAFFSELKNKVTIKDLGAGSVDGVAVTRYSAKVNVAQLLSQLKVVDPSLFKSSTSPTESSTVTLHVAIDAQHRLRQLSVTEHATAAGKTTTVSISITVTSYSASSSYQAPPASKTLPLSQLGGL